MKTFEIILVALLVLGALAYLCKRFKPKVKSEGGCGCGSTGCKVPKPRIDRPE
jgi:hypothetical protein